MTHAPKGKVPPEPALRMIWATRGRSWGFRFLLTGGLVDPLPEYERMFANLDHEPTALRHAAGTVALRFPDPAGRRDAAGRPIPHEFVLFGPLADKIESVGEGIRLVWPLVKEHYDSVWRDAMAPPSAADLGLAVQDNSSSRTPSG